MLCQPVERNSDRKMLFSKQVFYLLRSFQEESKQIIVLLRAT